MGGGVRPTHGKAFLLSSNHTSNPYLVPSLMPDCKLGVKNRATQRWSGFCPLPWEVTAKGPPWFALPNRSNLISLECQANTVTSDGAPVKALDTVAWGDKVPHCGHVTRHVTHTHPRQLPVTLEGEVD